MQTTYLSCQEVIPLILSKATVMLESAILLITPLLTVLVKALFYIFLTLYVASIFAAIAAMFAVGKRKIRVLAKDAATNKHMKKKYRKSQTLKVSISCLQDGSNGNDNRDLFSRNGLTQDVVLHVCSFLYPQSLTTVACTNKSSRDLIDGCCNFSRALWRSLWFRDYGLVLLRWEVSRNAFLNSFSGSSSDSIQRLIQQTIDSMENSKAFYFLFRHSFVDYVLAGKNGKEQCLMGIHGHIFDFTEFAPHHPGLSEPILVECGRDVTEFFEDVSHSKVARAIACKLCLIVDRSCFQGDEKGCGLYRVPSLKRFNENSLCHSNTRPPSLEPQEERLGVHKILPQTYFTKPKRPDTLYVIRENFIYNKQNAEALGKRQNTTRALCDIRVYYDPFRREWKGWYLDYDWNPIFCNLKA
uniref:Cytochrome b5 heme-binding domain-containing protein n=1 Tax=Corethron hystrix TaxID=216773 RepID=A0A7S1BYM0_9STRA|mmetsp:Transcript_6960/g.15037  ORF Transcript_6960/g.15037 Transcript_6960/m.15037 type:complete len:413 (+) Transcript_6960:171-1409(+)